MCCNLMLYCICYFILLEAADSISVDARHELVFRARIFTLLKLQLANVVNLADE